jgi:hypothetical protein
MFAASEQASFRFGNCTPAILLKSTLVICYFYAGGHNMKSLYRANITHLLMKRRIDRLSAAFLLEAATILR